MLSRVASKAVASPSWARPVQMRALSTTQTNNAEERDEKNFPRRQRPIHTPPVRHHWIPESYFAFMHQKTGVTGGYVLPATVLTALLSKEMWVMEHEFYTIPALLIVWGGIARAMKTSGTIQMIDDAVDAEEAQFKAIRQDEIDKCKAEIASEEKAQYMATSYEELIAAKKEAVGLQLEAAYRARLQDAYTQVKKRLDYQLEISNVLRRAEQKHMVDWIIGSVRKAITPKQEEEALKKCVADLKALA